jgi:RNA polymerase sigma-70 factor (ECF subfamily)
MIGVSYNNFPNALTMLAMDLDEEQKLVADAKMNRDAFGRLYDLYFPKVYAFVAAKVYEKSDAEDIVSEIFIKILENLDNFEWRGVPFGAWIFKIARNVINDYFNKTNKHKTYDIEETKATYSDEENNSPLKKASQEELSATVTKVLSSLPERELTVVQLKFFSQLSNREIMHVMDLSESNVAVILYRTLKRIKPELKYFN